MAERLKKGLREKGCKFLIDSPTNQQFVVLDQDTIRRLEEQVAFSIWEPVDENHTAVRFCHQLGYDAGDGGRAFLELL